MTPLLAHHGGALQAVLQLADVAGPVVAHEHAERAVGDPELPALLLADLGHQEAGQVGHVLDSLGQGGDEDGHNVEAVVKVLAEVAGLDLVFKVAVGGSNDAHVYLLGAGPTDPLELPLLEHAQEPGLEGQADLADLVEEEGTAVGLLETPLALGYGAGEGALLVTEKLRLQQVVWKGGAVQPDEGTARARGVVVDGVGDQLLAGAGLAADEDGGVPLCDLADLLEDEPHGVGAADDAVETMIAARLPAQIVALLLELPRRSSSTMRAKRTAWPMTLATISRKRARRSIRSSRCGGWAAMTPTAPSSPMRIGTPMKGSFGS
jgi:hypothetical protein